MYVDDGMEDAEVKLTASCCRPLPSSLKIQKMRSGVGRVRRVVKFVTGVAIIPLIITGWRAYDYSKTFWRFIE